MNQLEMIRFAFFLAKVSKHLPNYAGDESAHKTIVSQPFFWILTGVFFFSELLHLKDSSNSVLERIADVGDDSSWWNPRLMDKNNWLDCEIIQADETGRTML